MKTNRKTKRQIALLIVLFTAMVVYVISPLDFLPAFATSFAGCIDDVAMIAGAIVALFGIIKRVSAVCSSNEDTKHEAVSC